MTALDDQLLEAVVEQIKQDLNDQDETALYELLANLPKRRLMAYLPDEIQETINQKK